MMQTNKKKILVIDDNALMVRLLTFVLQKAGYDTRVATNGKEGIDTAKSWEPDAVITDFHMPFLNGYEVCANLRADPATKHIKIVIITASAKDEIPDQIWDSGADEVLTKTFQPKTLLDKLDRLLRPAAA